MIYTILDCQTVGLNNQSKLPSVWPSKLIIIGSKSSFCAVLHLFDEECYCMIQLQSLGRYHVVFVVEMAQFGYQFIECIKKLSLPCTEFSPAIQESCIIFTKAL